MERFELVLSLDLSGRDLGAAPLNEVADLLARELVERLRLGADYGTMRDDNGAPVGSWNINLD
jgi:hypothetical protein